KDRSRPRRWGFLVPGRDGNVEPLREETSLRRPGFLLPRLPTVHRRLVDATELRDLLLGRGGSREHEGAERTTHRAPLGIFARRRAAGFFSALPWYSISPNT